MIDLVSDAYPPVMLIPRHIRYDRFSFESKRISFFLHSYHLIDGHGWNAFWPRPKKWDQKFTQDLHRRKNFKIDFFNHYLFTNPEHHCSITIASFLFAEWCKGSLHHAHHDRIAASGRMIPTKEASENGRSCARVSVSLRRWWPASEAPSKTILMGHKISYCHAPVVRSFSKY